MVAGFGDDGRTPPPGADPLSGAPGPEPFTNDTFATGSFAAGETKTIEPARALALADFSPT